MDYIVTRLKVDLLSIVCDDVLSFERKNYSKVKISLELL
jgi:hypothetical protein